MRNRSDAQVMRKSRVELMMRPPLSEFSPSSAVFKGCHVVEGDLLEHVDGSLWVVKGCVHTVEGPVALPRVFEGKKIKRYSEAIEVVRRYYLHYVKYVEEIDRAVPIVPWSKVSRVLRWFHEGRSRCDESASLVLKILEGIGLECGVAGSRLGGYHGVKSDIDVHCLDKPGAYESIRLLYSRGLLDHMDFFDALREAAEVLEPAEDRRYLLLMTRRYLQGKFRGKRVTIRLVNCERLLRFLGPYLDRKFGEFLLELSESDYRTPAIMKATVVRASVAIGGEAYLISHRVRLTELPEGTLLRVLGYARTSLSGEPILNLDEAEVSLISLPDLAS